MAVLRATTRKTGLTSFVSLGLCPQRLLQGQNVKSTSCARCLAVNLLSPCHEFIRLIPEIQRNTKYRYLRE